MKIKTNLYADLHLLFTSGLDLNSVLEILVEQAGSESLRERLSRVHSGIISGKGLAEALQEEGLAGEYEYYSLKIGEESGKLGEVLSEIKKYYERRQRQRRQVSSAMTYPVLVLGTAVLAVGFMLNVIVPMFEEVFERFQGSLPALTQRIIDMSDWMKQYFWLVLLIVAGLVLGFRLLGKKLWFKRFMHLLVLRIPVFGPLVKSMSGARFCHVMALLASARTPLTDSLRMVSKMIAFLPLRGAIEQSEEAICKGSSLYASLADTGYFDKKFTSLIKAAEEVNQLAYAYEKLYTQYSEESEFKLSVLEKMMEPFLIVLVGGMVAVILIAMYLPLFQIGTSIY